MLRDQSQESYGFTPLNNEAHMWGSMEPYCYGTNIFIISEHLNVFPNTEKNA